MVQGTGPVTDGLLTHFTTTLQLFFPILFTVSCTVMRTFLYNINPGLWLIPTPVPTQCEYTLKDCSKQPSNAATL